MISIITSPASHRHLATAQIHHAAVEQRDRSKPHYTRKVYHMVMGLFCFSLYAFFLNRTQALITLGVVGTVWISCDILRVLSPKCNVIALRMFGSVMRRDELNRLSANSFYIVGLTVVTFCFPKPVALLSVLFLAFGDPIAAIVGTLWGKHKIGNTKKSIEGAAANFAVSSILSTLFAALYLHLSADKILLIAFMGGMISTLAELVPLPGDDNFSIPVVSGALFSVANVVLPVIR